MKTPKHGGKRTGAGAPLKSDSPRSMWSGRLPDETIAKLKKHATSDLSQADIVTQAVDQWSAARNGHS